MKYTTMKLIAVLSFLLTLSLTAFAQDNDRKVQYFSGTLAPGAEKTFKIDAEVGQYINAVITSKKGNVMIAEEEGARELTVEAIASVYDLVIYNRGKKAEKYKLKVTVYKPEPEPPERIELAECEIRKTIDLKMYPYKRKRRFVVKIEAGVEARFVVNPRELRKRLEFRLITSPSFDETWRDYEASLLIFAETTADYVFSVTKKDEDLLEGKMMVDLSGPYYNYLCK